METEIRYLLEREAELREILSYVRLVAFDSLTTGQKILINQERGGIFRAIDFIKKYGIEPDRYVIPESVELAVENLQKRMMSKRWKKEQEQGIL